MVVLLFDIDGTLIKTGGAGGQALMEAFSETFGISEPREVPFSGRTDRGITQDLCRLHGVEETPANWDRLCRDYLQRLEYYLPRRPGEILPGVQALLSQLQELNHIATGLLTGNMRDGARLKLQHYGLSEHFTFGGFGDTHVDRDDVAREALVASRAHTNGDLAAEQVWVIGDTPLDIQCARAIGAKSAAVATGWHSLEQLEDAGPDLLLADLRQGDLILQQLR